MASIIDQIRARNLKEGRWVPQNEREAAVKQAALSGDQTTVKELIQQRNSSPSRVKEPQKQPTAFDSPFDYPSNRKTTQKRTSTQEFISSNRSKNNQSFQQRKEANRDELLQIGKDLRDSWRSRSEIESELKRRIRENDYSRVNKWNEKLNVSTNIDLIGSTLQQDQPELANQIFAVNNEFKEIKEFQENIFNRYAKFEEALQWALGDIVSQRENLWGELLWKLDTQINSIKENFGEWGRFEKAIDQYYDDYARSLGNMSAERQAQLRSQFSGTWLSFAFQKEAIRQIDNETFENFQAAMKQKITDQQSLYSNLVAYLDTYRKEFGETVDQNIIEGYKDILQLKNAIGTGIINDSTSLEQLLLNRQSSSAAQANQGIINSTSADQAPVFTDNGVQIVGVTPQGYYVGADRQTYQLVNGRLVPVTFR